MIRIQLPDAEVGRLEEVFRASSDPKLRDRVQIVLMANRGRPHQGIAADLAVTPRTVQRWLNAYTAGGLDGLRPKKAKGRAGAIPASLADEVKRWVIDGPAKHGLDRANRTHEELAGHLRKATGSAPPGARPSGSAPGSGFARTDRRTGSCAPTRTSRRRPGRSWRHSKKADAGALVLLSQDEARVQMVPTLTAALGVKGHRPVVGTRDDKDVLFVLAVLNAVSGLVHANTHESVRAANRRSGESKSRRMQRAFAAHLRHVGRHTRRPNTGGWC